MADPVVVAGLLLARCATLNVGTPKMPVAMPDVAFNSPADGRYLRVDLFTNAPFWEGLTSGRVDQGLLQVTVVWPKGKGLIVQRRAAKQVMDHFAKGLKLFGPATRVTVNREPWAASPIPGDVSTETPVTISWTAS
ncbi:hypothetical protein FM111_01900 [Brevundimonas diminuta 3F5N]|uniref:Uncharacterized protein n=1 Tax=Brevundimonas diminuta 3F5N TaxID=1255603 RepID=A0A1R4F0W9_BREDI|nr:phage tail terminator-like protein [Brevundimonas diminuta]SJM49569.1 hypothetical protein FM111_01900 [Brevundimonas diminuta 3F5N]